VLFGVLFLLMKERLHLDSLRIWGPRVVGLTLIAIGVHGDLLKTSTATVTTTVTVTGTGTAMGTVTATATVTVTSTVTGTAMSRWSQQWQGAGVGRGQGCLLPLKPWALASPVSTLLTLFTGIVHGLQPDALLVVLPALAMPSRAAGAAFLALFLLGTVVAMGSYTAFIGSCSDALRDRVPGVTRNLSLVAAAMAIALGVGMLVGEVFGLQFL